MCKAVKPLSMYHKDAAKLGGHRHECKDCRAKAQKATRRIDGDRIRAQERAKFAANRSVYRARLREYSARNRDTLLASVQRRKHGLSEAVVFNLWAQNCSICNAPPGTTKYRHHIDHDHTVTGAAAIRGVLCCGCNVGLGRLEAGTPYGERTSSPEWVAAAQTYLDRYDAALVVTAALPPQEEAN